MKLVLELTDRCNFHCVHCIREEPEGGGFLDPGVIARVLGQAGDLGVGLVAFTGGEPTLHPDLGPILEDVARNGLRFTLVTNAWTFASTWARIEPHRSHLDHLTISLDGARAETHDRLRAQPGSFARILEAIDTCVARDVAVHLNMVVTRSNRDEVEDLVRLATRRGCSGVHLGHCQPTPDAVQLGLVLSPAERRRVEAEAAELGRMVAPLVTLAGDHHDEGPFQLCPQLRLREINVDHRGRLTACCVLSGFRGASSDEDVIADLREVPLARAVAVLANHVAEIQRAKLERATSGSLREVDRFLCTLCLERHGKIADVAEALGPSAAPALACR